jgi:PII-like signaling protein
LAARNSGEDHDIRLNEPGADAVKAAARTRRTPIGGNVTHERFEGERTLMRIHIGESDKWHGKPLYGAIVDLLRKEGFSGVTVLPGVAGYGGSSVYHTDKVLRLSQDLPIILEVVETTERIDQILPRLDGMVEGGLITLEKVRVILYRAAKK